MSLSIAKKIRIRLSSVEDCARTNTDVLVHDDGRVFVTEKVWKRIHSDDPRVSKATQRDIRGSIDMAPLSFEGVAIRFPTGHVEVTFRSEGCIATYYAGGKPRATAAWSLDSSMRRYADLLVTGVLANSSPIHPTRSRTSHTNTSVRIVETPGRIDIGACMQPRCLEERTSKLASAATGEPS
jgi:hypothetical protein